MYEYMEALAALVGRDREDQAREVERELAAAAVEKLKSTEGRVGHALRLSSTGSFTASCEVRIRSGVNLVPNPLSGLQIRLDSVRKRGHFS
jgi:hypothetical protein